MYWCSMDKYSVDYSLLDEELNKPKIFKYEDVKHRLEKVAFGTVRFMDANEDIDGLWEIQATDDGEFIVAKYDYEDKNELQTKSSWDVVLDNRKEAMHIFYKGEPVTKVAASSFGDVEDLSLICKTASVRLENDCDFRQMLIDELPLSEKGNFLSKYPELAK